MLYSLSRFHHHSPMPPFQLGGEYLTYDNRQFLIGADISIEIIGPADLFIDLSQGDLAIAQVTAIEGARRLRVSEIAVTVRAREQLVRAPKPHAVRFIEFLHRVHAYFRDHGFNEIHTPTLVRCPGLEPSLEPFAVEVTYGRHRETAYLPTSPEIHLKKALALGWTDIYEIKGCFRKGEFSSHHDNEFHMLEWYRGFADLELIERDLRDLIKTLAQEGWVEGEAQSLEATDFASLFKDAFDFKLTPETTAAELKTLCETLSVHTTDDDSFNDLFHRLFVDRIEPSLKRRGPLLVKRFPPSQAALAKLDGDGWADRFELYWRGLEIANAFNEVNDPEEQAKRWAIEQKERKRLGTADVPTDPEMIVALGKGMPPTGGIALGVERLYMACAGVKDIRELKLFSTADLFGR